MLLTLAAVAALLVWAGVAVASGSSSVASGAVAPPTLSTDAPPASWLVTPPAAVAGRGASSTQTLFFDNFETGLSKWTLQGSPGWATTTYRAAGGSYSAYCAGSAISPPGPYVNNQAAWMFAGPFNLSQATAATLSMSMYSVTELNKDYLDLYVSINNENYYGTGYSGSFDSWSKKSLDLTNVYTLGNVCGKSQVWIAVLFKSDPAIVYEGSYVDDVTLTATMPSTGPKEAGIVLTADAETVAYNGAVYLTGALLDAAGGFLIPGKSVDLVATQENVLDPDVYLLETLQSTTGDYQTAWRIKKNTYFQLQFAGDSEYALAYSNVALVKARCKLTPPAVPSAVRSRVKYESWGTIKPPHTSAQNRTSHTKVYFEHYLGGKWTKALSFYAQKYRNTSSETQYAIRMQYAPGRWRVMAVHLDDDHARTASSWRTFTAY